MKISINLDDLEINDDTVGRVIQEEMHREIQILVRGVVRESRKELRELVERAAKDTVESFKKGKLSLVAKALGAELGV